MSSPYGGFNTRQTPQTQFIPGQEYKQVKNEAGGVGYRLGDWDAFDRFLMLGSEGGSYYIGEAKLTRENALRVMKCIHQDGARAINRIVEVSDTGRAPKNDPAIFALALAAAAPDVKTRQLALDALPKVCRIPTHLFHFLEYIKGQRGWGRTLKRAVAEWYNQMPVDRLAYEMVKYQQRDGWSNRDVLRKSHPKTGDAIRNSLYKWAVDGYDVFTTEDSPTSPPLIVNGFEAAKMNDGRLLDLIRQHNLSREMLPTEALTKPEVWAALLERMPYTAMLRNLGNMSKVGLLKPLSDASSLISKRLLDPELIQKGRVHPVAIMLASKVYGQGKGIKGHNEWDVTSQIMDALNDAFYLAFKFQEPTNKRFLIGVDCSGSMAVQVSGLPLSAAEGAAAMALSIAKVEPNFHTVCFDDQIRRVPTLTPRMRLDEVLAATSRISASGTDCAVPILYALEKGIKVDAFVIVTDNATWRGKEHVSQALIRYRQRSGVNAKLVAIAMVASDNTICDPDDVGCLNVSGFDASVPALVQEFCR